MIHAATLLRTRRADCGADTSQEKNFRIGRPQYRSQMQAHNNRSSYSILGRRSRAGALARRTRSGAADWEQTADCERPFAARLVSAPPVVDPELTLASSEAASPDSVRSNLLPDGIFNPGSFRRCCKMQEITAARVRVEA